MERYTVDFVLISSLIFKNVLNQDDLLIDREDIPLGNGFRLPCDIQKIMAIVQCIRDNCLEFRIVDTNVIHFKTAGQMLYAKIAMG
jgi:hypothetical protein